MIPAALLAREASERGTSPGVLRRIVVEGFAVLPGTDVLPVRSRTFLMQPQEGPQEFVDRLIATYPAIDSADHAQEFRAALCACRVVRVADVGRERVEQALRLLASGTTVPAQANRSMAIRTQVLIGGSREAHFRHCRSILDESESTVAMKQDFKAAGLHSVALNTVIEFGLAAPTDAHLVRGNVAPIDLEPTSAIETLRRRFRELKPQGAGGTSIGRIAQYASVRRIIGLDALDDHPEALVHDVVDWLIAKGIAPGVKDVHGALQGPVEQIRAILRRRHFERQDVQLPPRKGSFVEFSLADFRTLLPGPLQQAAGTILDPENGTALNAPRGVDLAAVSQNVHPILREVAAIVALHGPTDPSLASIQKEANIALRYLSGVMSGADPRRAGDVIVCLQAVRHVANGTTGQERRRLLRAIRAWPWIVRIFESFRSLPSISEKTAVHLDGIAPVMPASLAPLLAEVRQECGSAWKRDPGSGVIGVEKGPLIPVV